MNDNNNNNNLNTQPNNENKFMISTPPTVTPQPVETTNPVGEVPVVNPAEVQATVAPAPTEVQPVQVTPQPTVGEVAPVTPQVQPAVNTNINPSINPNGEDPNAIVNEKLKKVEINYTPPSKFKTVLLILFFIFLIGFVIFLPEISSLVRELKGGNVDEPKEEVITTGKLNCYLSTSTTNLDKEYDLTFSFTDNKLEKTHFVITTKGDVTLDEETLDGLNEKCKLLKENTKGLAGVSISCKYTEGKLEEIQSFDLKNVDSSKLGSAFSEAGGNNPEYQYGQDIDKIESGMNASKYTCKRER